MRQANSILLAAAVVLVGCQNYDFEPVRPIALTQARIEEELAGTRNKPNLMLVVDKSGSMNAPIDGTNPACSSQCQAGTGVCGAGCDTRWTALQASVTGFLASTGAIARMGLMTYPTNAACNAPTDPRIELVSSESDGELQSHANAIASELSDITMAVTGSPQSGDDQHTGGGTPTGNALSALKRYAALADPDRKNYVLLLTDGLPNCNANNPVDGVSNPSACFCQASSCSGEFSRLGCLDAGGTIQQLNELTALDVETIVVGFGIDTNNATARETLQAMGQAGGYSPRCEEGDDAACGPRNTCVSGQCRNAYFDVRNGAELAQALESIRGTIIGDICDFKLTATPQNNSAEFIAVRVDGASVSAGVDAWSYDTAKKLVTLEGALCQRVRAAPETAPVKVEVRVVQSL